jgi:PAB1-binding protein PBP1
MTSHSMVGRELKRWQPSADDAPLEGGLEDSRGGAWDQFGVNQHKFGVQTSFEVGLTHDVAHACADRPGNMLLMAASSYHA